ncbi:methyltransferase domain-containing protein [Streptomyces sp. ISL-11]|uniref:methyltransferase domain-containing protein n=1 Tax=Streptomyces sp. ISL-11 TaxID=2819174 RepID=UPI001BE75B73|nr:methyltransferase domain-containing protein [Streptomyces sp. ISL-11]MBT2384571.1 methyltransferase domain-containing protein [Streptomyces sp. ISL-11]
MTDDYPALRRRCAQALADDGQFTDPWVRPAIENVPREAFVPPRFWIKAKREDGGYPLIDRDTNPETWATTVYTPGRALITQMDDGATAPADGAAGRFTSSLSELRVVARQLSHLALERGHNVLHIGTGSGYDCALMAERTPADHVTTVEIDELLAADARRNLTAAGYGDVRTVCGDGEQGRPQGGPYDRVLCTASAMRVPSAWIDQTAPGGVILTPYRGLALARLVVSANGKTASGPIVDGMTFMTLRGQRGADAADMSPVINATLSDSDKTRTDVDLSPLEAELGAEFLLHALVPGMRGFFGESTWWFEAHDGASWAAWKRDGRVRQWGPRRLVDEAAQAVTTWRKAGAPALTDLGVTVGPEGERLWAHGPGGPSWDAEYRQPDPHAGAVETRTECT